MRKFRVIPIITFSFVEAPLDQGVVSSISPSIIRILTFREFTAIAIFRSFEFSMGICLF